MTGATFVVGIRRRTERFSLMGIEVSSLTFGNPRSWCNCPKGAFAHSAGCAFFLWSTFTLSERSVCAGVLPPRHFPQRDFICQLRAAKSQVGLSSSSTVVMISSQLVSSPFSFS